jgi:hypothetical protein
MLPLPARRLLRAKDCAQRFDPLLPHTDACLIDPDVGATGALLAAAAHFTYHSQADSITTPVGECNMDFRKSLFRVSW